MFNLFPVQELGEVQNLLCWLDHILKKKNISMIHFFIVHSFLEFGPKML